MTSGARPLVKTLHTFLNMTMAQMRMNALSCFPLNPTYNDCDISYIDGAFAVAPHPFHELYAIQDQCNDVCLCSALA